MTGRIDALEADALIGKPVILAATAATGGQREAELTCSATA